MTLKNPIYQHLLTSADMMKNRKKLSRIINATRKLNKEGYKFRVVFVGKGIDTKSYYNMAKDLKNVIFLGAKTNPYPYLRLSDCFVMSSEFEGYPVTLVEAEILSKPIITTDISDAKEEIDKKYGIIVEKSDSNGIYEGMKQFLDEGIEIDKFSPEKYNEDIIKKLEKIFLTKFKYLKYKINLMNKYKMKK